jgi:hypothetical protein
MTQPTLPELHFVTCASNLNVLGQRLLASPCLKPGAEGAQVLTVVFNASSAAEGFNAAMAADAAGVKGDRWLVWVHQDVYLPQGWDLGFAQALAAAAQRFPDLAVAGVYGIAGAGVHAQRAGRVLDRGVLLHEPAALPCEVDSLDELLFAVRVDSGLMLDPDMGFDFYATDLVLQAQALGLRCAVVEGYCEHWSDTPQFGVMPPSLLQRVLRNASVFETKWSGRLPVTTPCFDIVAKGDVARAVANVYQAQ